MGVASSGRDLPILRMGERKVLNVSLCDYFGLNHVMQAVKYTSVEILSSRL